ncbi:MAG: HAMP domain-containing protein [Hyphomicrobiaceae bacterium]|nr:MAG: HAMP domain-containing protein [Hyphomicrobiaceae bacterium]
MAVETGGSRFAAGATETLRRSLAAFGAAVRMLAAAVTRVTAGARAFVRHSGLYEFLTYGPLIRLVTRTLQRRIIFANIIGLLILLGGIFYLSQSHAWLIEAKRESLRAQGEIIAAAIAANASVETGRIVLDPDKLPEVEGARSPFRDDGFAALQLSIAPERVTPILRRLVPATDTRARIYAHDGTLIIDTAQLLQRRQLARHDTASGGEHQERAKIKNTWTRFLSWLLRGELPVYREIGGANGTAYPEVRMALSGSTTPMLLINDKGEQIVSVAVPIQYRKAVQGVLLLSTRPGEIDEVLSEERNVIFGLALLALATTLLASFLLARTIAGPMRRLSEAAENVSHNIKARHELPELAHRADEVGQMAAAFRGMTESLYRRIEASERFAQDVAHELKNPLTAARSTAEALTYAKTPAQQQQLVQQIQEELKRLNKLISDVASASRLDAELAFEETEPVDIRQVLRAVVDVFRDRLGPDRLVLEIAPAQGNPDAYVVRGHEARLGRVLTNLFDNAISFSPEDGVLTVRARRLGPEIEIVVDDEGPGIPPGQLEAVFDRFYSDRPQTDHTLGKNSGLGLSISRDIVNAYGGRIWAENRLGEAGTTARVHADHAALKVRRQPGILGARFIVRLPGADTAATKGGQLLGRRV